MLRIDPKRTLILTLAIWSLSSGLLAPHVSAQPGPVDPHNREVLDFAFVPVAGVPDTYDVYLIWRAGSRSGGVGIDLSTRIIWSLGAPLPFTDQPMVGSVIDLCAEASGACPDGTCGAWEVGGELRDGCCMVDTAGACECGLVFVTRAPNPVVLQPGQTVSATLRPVPGALSEIDLSNDTLVAVFDGPRALGNRGLNDDAISLAPTSDPGQFEVRVEWFAEVPSEAQFDWRLDTTLELSVNGTVVDVRTDRLRPLGVVSCGTACGSATSCATWVTSTSTEPGECRLNAAGLCVCALDRSMTFDSVAISPTDFVSVRLVPTLCSDLDGDASDDEAGDIYQPSHPSCGAVDLVENKIKVSLPTLPDPMSVLVLTSPVIDVRTQNDRGEDVQVELVGHVHAGGKRVQASLSRMRIPPGGAQTVQIDLSTLGVDLAALEYSGRLSIEARTLNRRRIAIERDFLPAFYFHQEAVVGGPIETHVYRADARRAFYNAGDFNFLTYPDGTPDGVIAVFDGGEGLGSHGEDQGPQPANDDFLAPSSWEFCMRWVYESIDSGFGEDYYQAGTLMKARGMRVTVDHPNWAGPEEYFCNTDNGCFSFFAPENNGFIVTIHAEARLGSNDNLTVRAFDTKSDAIVNPTEPPTWTFVANPGGLPRRVYYQNEPGEQSNLMAFGSFVLHWVDSHTSPGLPGPESLYLVSDNPSCEGSCQPSIYVEMQPGKTNRKFLVGHEVGHWIHRQWTNNDMGYDQWSWSANSSDPDCAFDGVGAHAMRSKEYAVGAFIEGFAHFISALAWNDHTQTNGWFKYYKEVDEPVYDDMEADNWRVDLEGAGLNPVGGVTNWMANLCTVHDGHSVEMDWLRHFWDYRTNPGTKPSHHDIFQHVAFTMANYPWANNYGAYDQLWTAIQDGASGLGAFVDRWLDAAEWNGVAQ